MTVRLDRVDARARLKPRREPYWHRLSEGHYLGYRRMAASAPGSWIARVRGGTARTGSSSYDYESLGDFAGLEERARFDAAKRQAEAWFEHLDHGGSTDRITVKQACENYVTKLRTERSDSSADDAQGVLKRFVTGDAIAEVELAKLAPRHVAEWRARVLKRGRAKATVNRIMTGLRAALNLAHDRRDAASDHAWRTELKALDAPSGRRTLYLDRDQRRSLIDAASDELRPLVKALCLLPLRVGELAACRVADFDSAHGVLRVAGKTGQRDVPLSKDAITFFRECAKSKLPTAWLIARADGRQWDRFTWRDDVKLAAAAAHLPGATTLYTLRHSTITDLVTDGLDLFTTAQVSGTSVAMIEQHYGKLRSQIAREALDKLAL